MNIPPLKISVCSLLLLFFLINYPLSTCGWGFTATVVYLDTVRSKFSDGRHIMKGRDALLDSNPKAALPNFEAIAQSNPNYINCFQGLCIGIWTYLGRTYHELANNQKALESLNKGKGRYYTDRFNKIYLGLVMAQTGETQEGKVELDAGLEALGDWLAALAGRGITGQYWDPSGNLEKGIADTRALLQGGLINWDKVNKYVHWLGVNFEEEVRDVHRDKQHDNAGGDD